MIYPDNVPRCHEVIRALHSQYLEQASRAAAAEMQRDAAVEDVHRLHDQNKILETRIADLDGLTSDLTDAAGIGKPAQPDDQIDDVFGEGGAL